MIDCDINSILPSRFCNVFQVLPNEDGSNVLPVSAPSGDGAESSLLLPKRFLGSFVQSSSWWTVKGRWGFRSRTGISRRKMEKIRQTYCRLVKRSWCTQVQVVYIYILYLPKLGVLCLHWFEMFLSLFGTTYVCIFGIREGCFLVYHHVHVPFLLLSHAKSCQS